MAWTGFSPGGGRNRIKSSTIYKSEWLGDRKGIACAAIAYRVGTLGQKEEVEKSLKRGGASAASSPEKILTVSYWKGLGKNVGSKPLHGGRGDLKKTCLDAKTVCLL